MSNTVPTWAQIEQTSEFEFDERIIKDLIVKSFGNDTILDKTNAFIQIIAKLAAISRYYARHLPDNKDIDLSPFFLQLCQEVGFDLPFLQKVPALELLRENKRWYGHKGTETLYDFAGDLIGSPIEIDFPRDLIFTLDATRSCLDGARSNSGMLPWNQSKLAHLHDGVFWAQFVFIVRILQAQNATDYVDLISILNNILPIGMRQVIYWVDNYYPTNLVLGHEYLFDDVIQDYFFPPKPYPTLDNGFILDGPNGKLDSIFGNTELPADQGGFFSTTYIDFHGIARLEEDHTFLLLPSTTLFNKLAPVPTSPWAAFSRDRIKRSRSPVTGETHIYSTGQTYLQLLDVGFGLADVPSLVKDTTTNTTYIDGIDYTLDTIYGKVIWITLPNNGDTITVDYDFWDTFWETVFSDNDSIVYQNVTTNMGLVGYEYQYIENLTYRELQDVAWNLDGANQTQDAAVVAELQTPSSGSFTLNHGSVLDIQSVTRVSDGFVFLLASDYIPNYATGVITIGNSLMNGVQVSINYTYNSFWLYDGDVFYDTVT